jgi:hypothetical protein
VSDLAVPGLGVFIFAALAVPALLFYMFLGAGWLCIPLGAALLLALPRFRSARAPLASQTILACAVAALALTVFGGEGRFLPATQDWIVRDAVLHDVAMRSWPFVYRFAGTDFMLRTSLGMYLLPGLAGKLAGLRAAYLALLVQNTACIMLILLVFCDAPTWRRSLCVIIVFCLFSGWDVPGGLFLSALLSSVTHQPVPLPADIGWWNHLFQYSSTITLAYWVPNHALAGWLLTALLLLWERGKIRIGALMAGAALTLIWSPFALLGGLPFLIKAGLTALFSRRLNPFDLVTSVLVVAALAPAVLYLISDTGGVPRGYSGSGTALPFGPFYLMFIGFEVLPILLINRLFWPAERGGITLSTYWVAALSLLAIPFFKIGNGNDFVMRASIPALAIMAIATGHNLASVIAARRPWRIGVVLTVVALGALTGIDQTCHVLIAPNNGISRCDFIQAWAQDLIGVPVNTSPMTPYLAREPNVPALLRPAHPQIYSTALLPGRCTDSRI